MRFPVQKNAPLGTTTGGKCNIVEVDAENINFHNAKLSECVFTKANLRGALLAGANLLRANLEGKYLGNLRKCHLTNVVYENVTFMRPWTDSSTWEESVRHLEESMNEELTHVLSNVEESIPDASHASPDASHALPDASHASPTHPMWRSPSTDA
ncbi:putative pentapeptide [Helianthus anomalus]